MYSNLTLDRRLTILETTLFRFNTETTPSGRFPVYSDNWLPIAHPRKVRVGHDAAVCVQISDPWIIETYNTSVASPSALRIVGRGNDSTPLSPSGNIRGTPIANTRYLNATGKVPVFNIAHGNSLSGMVNGNGWNDYYTPSPAVSPFVLPHTAFLLTSTYSAGGFFHRRSWTRGIH